MTVEKVTVSSLLGRALHHWRLKLASLVAALLVWLFVTSSSVTTTQRNLTVPLSVEGVSDDQVAVGLPTMVEVAVSGPGPRIDRLRPDMLRATLDLSDAAGSFERPITVQPPAEIRVLEVVPADVIGFLESVTTRQLPISVALTGSLPDNQLLNTSVGPTSAVLTGRGLVLDSVVSVLAVAPVTGGEVRLVALDANGSPVDDLTIAPATAQVTVSARAALVTRSVAIELTVASTPNLASVTLSSDEVELAGDVNVLADLGSVVGTVDAPTGEVLPGRYTLPVRLALPDGVAALSTPTATLQYVTGPIEP